MSIQHHPAFNLIGIAVRTTNENGQAATDIPALWGRFMAEGILQQIPGRIDDTIYCLYTGYEKDHTRPYTTLLGCRVANLEHIPEGMTGKSIEGAAYEKFVAKGDPMKGSVYNEWLKIWSADIPRTFIADFEVYGPKSQQPDAEVDIFLGVKF
ncbi:AraC family transcriptional regulator [Chitinophaga lutea]|uniref:AraC family transcriptional regulator n=1 Tax=Chitinophaga lutea TaxID=2488634 RepID=A0A3N4PMB0_9BACT|nr:effector binding domain-containing protein [Chitinophaga lutea]RPE08718.1 AraC family transcriptional regulator [Chitinophaga lutea]